MAGGADDAVEEVRPAPRRHRAHGAEVTAARIADGRLRSGAVLVDGRTRWTQSLCRGRSLGYDLVRMTSGRDLQEPRPPQLGRGRCDRASPDARSATSTVLYFLTNVVRISLLSNRYLYVFISAKFWSFKLAL